MGLRRFSVAFLAYNFAVIVWGAFVRATRSGAGCGEHWPLCDGQFFVDGSSVPRVIEYTHRATSGLALIGSIVAFVWARRAAGPGSPLRRAGAMQLGFMLMEAALGAGLVIFQYVAGDERLARGWVMGAHLINTFLLLTSLTLLVHHAHGGARPDLRATGPGANLLKLSFLMLVAVAVTGGIAALGDTLFHSSSLAEGFERDLSPQSHLFLRLRILHPTLALTAGLVAGGAAITWWLTSSDATTARWGRIATITFGTQVMVGIVNLTLLAPIPLQLVHLALADFLWVSLVFVAANGLRPADATAPATA